MRVTIPLVYIATYIAGKATVYTADTAYTAIWLATGYVVRLYAWSICMDIAMCSLALILSTSSIALTRINQSSSSYNS